MTTTKKLLVFTSLTFSLIYLSSAISITLNSGQKLESNSWTGLSGVLNKIDVNSGNIKVNGKLSVNGKICLADNSCLGECSGGQIWDTSTNSCIIPATTPETAGETCWTIRQNTPSAPSGYYYIKPSGYSTSTEVYCDMTTDGGGWTLMARATSTDNPSWSGLTSAARNTTNLKDESKSFKQADGFINSTGSIFRVKQWYGSPQTTLYYSGCNLDSDGTASGACAGGYTTYTSSNHTVSSASPNQSTYSTIYGLVSRNGAHGNPSRGFMFNHNDQFYVYGNCIMACGSQMYGGVKYELWVK